MTVCVAVMVACAAPPPDVTAQGWPAQIELSRDGWTEVPVELTRTGGHSEAVVIKIDGLPPTVTSDPLVIREYGVRGKLVLRATRDAPVGTRVTVAVVVESGAIRHSHGAVLALVQGFQPSVAGPVTVPRTGQIKVTVNLARAASYKDIIPVTLRGPNLTESTATASPASSSVELSVRPSGLNQAPAQIQATITANGANHAVEVPLTIQVTPVPGDWDLAFGTNGKAAVKSSGPVESLAVAADGAVFAVQADASQAYHLTRLSSAGQMSSAFGNMNGAYALSAPGSTAARGGGVALQSDGRAIFAAAARISEVGSQSATRIRLIRLSGTTGAVSTDFGSASGPVDIDLPLREGGSWLHQVQVGSNDSLLVTTVHQGGVTLIRLTKDGLPDSSFNATGQLGFPVADAIGGSLPAVSTLLLADGKIRVATIDRDQHYLGPTVTGEVRQFTPQGAIDSSFAADRRVFSLPHRRGSPVGLLLGQEGMVFVGAHNGSQGLESSWLRFTPEATLDPAFGSGGETSFVHGASSGTAPALFAEAPAKALYGTIGSEVYRLDASGRRDEGFGLFGRVRVHSSVSIAVGGPGNMLLIGDNSGGVIRVLP